MKNGFISVYYPQFINIELFKGTKEFGSDKRSQYNESFFGRFNFNKLLKVFKKLDNAPISSAQIEREFSKLTMLLTSQRLRLKDESIRNIIVAGQFDQFMTFFDHQFAQQNYISVTQSIFLTRINIFFYSSVIFKKSKKRKVNGKLNGFLTVFFTTKTETEKNGWKNFISANPDMYCGHEECQNSNGSFSCFCEDGFFNNLTKVT